MARWPSPGRASTARGNGRAVTVAPLGGWRAAGFLVAGGAWGRALLEIVNDMEHDGMVRDRRTPVRPRHSWNTNRRISSWTSP